MDTKLSVGELQNVIEKLEKELQDTKDKRDWWMSKCQKTESRFSNFRNMVKGLVVLVE